MSIDKIWHKISINIQNIDIKTDKAVLISIPHSCKKYDGYSFWFPKKLCRESKVGKGWFYTISFTDDFLFKLKKMGNGKYNKNQVIAEVEISAEEILDIYNQECNNSLTDDDDTQTMKKFVITDPCYLLSPEEKENNFGKYCDLLEEKDSSTAADEYLSSILGTKILSTSTGIGDWSCVMTSKDEKYIINSEFCADSGRVCFCELTDKIQKTLNNNIGQWCYAIICCENPVCKFTVKNNGTLVTITDKDRIFTNIIEGF